jgi:hypothetical protein
VFNMGLGLLEVSIPVNVMIVRRHRMIAQLENSYQRTSSRGSESLENSKTRGGRKEAPRMYRYWTCVRKDSECVLCRRSLTMYFNQNVKRAS